MFSGVREGKDLVPTSIKQEFFRWPTDSIRAADYALAEGRAGREAYFCAHLLTARRRVKDNAAPVAALYADADGPVDLDDVPPPTIVIQSSPGHYHLYWRLSRAIEAAQAADLNRRLAHAIGADPSGADLSQVLRVPGTPNQKRAGHIVRIVTVTHVAHEPEAFDRLPLAGETRRRTASAAASTLGTTGSPACSTPRSRTSPTPSSPRATVSSALSSATRPDGSEVFFRAPRWERVLREGDVENRYPLKDGSGVDRSAMLQALTLVALNEGRTFDELYVVLTDEHNRGGARLQDDLRQRGEAAARAYLQQGFDRAKDLRRPIAAPADVLNELAIMRWAIERRMSSWKGAGGAGARAVLEALISIAERTAKLCVGASRRDLGDLAGLRSRKSIARATRRLTRGGWLRCYGQPDEEKSLRWHLRVPRSLRRLGTSLVSQGEAGGGTTGAGASPPSDDVWRWAFDDARGLGKVAWLNWTTLQAKPLTAAQLGKVRGVDKRTAQRGLRRLADVGLAVRDESDQYTAAYPSFDVLAARLGTLGASDRQREVHKLEREDFKERLEHRRKVQAARGRWNR